MIIPILNKQCVGINNKLDSTRLSIGDSCELITGTDILIDQSGGIVSAHGNELQISGDYHSAFEMPDGTFLAILNRPTFNDSALQRLDPQGDGSLSIGAYLRSGMTINQRMSYKLVDEKVYYMNGFEKGVVVENGSYSDDWPTSEYPRDVEEVFLATPTGRFFDILSGYFIIASGKEIIWTESGLWGIVNQNESWEQLESDIRMVYSVETGVYISDSRAVYWCEGLNPKQWILKKVLDYPAIEYKRYSKLIDPTNFGFQTSAPSALFDTERGTVVGFPDGNIINLVDKRVVMPKNYLRGGIMIVDENVIITSGV